jgi:hypothetical protein
MLCFPFNGKHAAYQKQNAAAKTYVRIRSQSIGFDVLFFGGRHALIEHIDDTHGDYVDHGQHKECRQLKVSKVLQRASPVSGRRILPVQSQ